MMALNKLDRSTLLHQLYGKFNGYYDEELIERIFNERIEEVEKAYYDDSDINMDINLYVINRVERYIYLSILDRIKNEDDIVSEIYLIEKFRYVHNLYVRRQGKDKNDSNYEKAIEEFIEEYDGTSTISSYIYKKIASVYDKQEKSLKIKKVLDK